MAISSYEIEIASKKGSVAGGLCQLSGALLAVVGGLMTVGVTMNGGGLGGLLLGGSATFALALAGAPIAALGSIANSQKASKELLLLYIKNTAGERQLPPMEWQINPRQVERLRSERQTVSAPPPPPPPPPPPGMGPEQ